MFYEKSATLFTSGQVSDGMGGWIDSGKVDLAEIKVANAPVTAELQLREYGFVSSKSMKLYTEDNLPNEDFFVHFEDEDYRVLQLNDYGKEKIILMEVI